MTSTFPLLEPEWMTDKDLTLILREKCLNTYSDKVFPHYRFDMVNSNSKEIMGNISLIVGIKPNDYLLHWGNIGYNVKP